MLQGEWMIEFFAPWCPACKNLAPTWERFARVAKDVQVQVAKIDVTTSPSLSGRFFVTALPTIYH
uniref:Thioredoxin domain-containing protein n=2 Tax=Bilateria TaxID=33213 RepID=A0A8C2JJM8_CYPCA